MKRSIGLIISALVALMLVAAPAVAATNCVTRVGGTLPGGPGHSSTVWVGTWKCGSIVGFCGNFSLHGPDQSGNTKVISKMPGMSQAKSDIFAQINGTYRNTNDRATAMAAGYAEWKIVGDKSFKKYNKWAVKNNLFPSVRARASAMITKAKQQLGLKMTVSLKPALVGQTKKGNVLVTGANGAALAGVKVNLSVSNGTLSRTSGVSNANGKVGFKLKRTNVGKVQVSAKASVIRVRHILSTVPTVGQQHIYAVPLKKSRVAHASYDKQPGKPTVKSVCDTDCDGTATITTSYCNPVDAVTYRYQGVVSGNVVVDMKVAGGDCKSKRFVLTDGDKLTGKYCLVRGGDCFTGWVKIPGVFEVKCPPAPEVYFSAICDCEGVKDYTALVAVPASPRVFKARVTINGDAFGSVITLNNGQNNKIPLGDVKAGDTVSILITVYHQTSGAKLADWTYSDQAPVVGKKLEVSFKK